MLVASGQKGLGNKIKPEKRGRETTFVKKKNPVKMLLQEQVGRTTLDKEEVGWEFAATGFLLKYLLEVLSRKEPSIWL